MGVTAGIVSVIGTVSAAREERKARKRQEKAQKIEAKKTDIVNTRRRRQEIATARALRAQTIAQGETAGVSGSSSVQGAAGSVQTQAASNVSFLNTIATLDRARFNQLQGASDSLSRAGTFRAAAAFPTQLGFSPANTFQSFFKDNNNGGSVTG